MFRPSAVRPVGFAALLAFALSASTLAFADRALPPTSQAQAAGAPILPACDAMQATVNKLQAGLPVQDEWIKRSEQQLRAAEDGVRGAQAELQDIALKEAVKFVDNQLQMVRDMKAGISKVAASNATRQKWLDRVDKIKAAAEKVEQAEKLGKAGVAGNQLGTAIAQNRAQLVDFITLVNESGISDELGLKAAEFTGPAGVALVESFTVARDILYATFQGKMSADEAAAHRQNLAAMRSAKADVETRIYELNTELATPRCTPTPKPADRMGILKDTEPADAGAKDGSKDASKDKDKKGASTGKVVGALVVAGGVGVGTYYALGQIDKITEGDSGGSNSGSVKATFVSASTINCTFNAGGIINSCTGTVTIDISGKVTSGTTYRFQFDAGPGGNRTVTSAGHYTFSISGGTATSSCPTLRTASVFATSTSVVIGSFTNMSTSVSCK